MRLLVLSAAVVGRVSGRPSLLPLKAGWRSQLSGELVCWVHDETQPENWPRYDLPTPSLRILPQRRKGARVLPLPLLRFVRRASILGFEQVGIGRGVVGSLTSEQECRLHRLAGSLRVVSWTSDLLPVTPTSKRINLPK